MFDEREITMANKTICVFVEVNEDLEIVDVDVDTFNNEEEINEEEEVEDCPYCYSPMDECECEFCSECGELLE